MGRSKEPTPWEEPAGRKEEALACACAVRVGEGAAGAKKGAPGTRGTRKCVRWKIKQLQSPGAVRQVRATHAPLCRYEPAGPVGDHGVYPAPPPLAAPSARFAPDAVVGDGTESLSDADCRTAFGAVDTDPGTPVGIAWQLRAHGRQRPGFKSQPGHLFSVRPGVVSLSSLHVAAPNCGMEQ